MPTRKIACRCGGIIESGKCSRCNRGRRQPDSRRSAARRGYDRHWQATRLAKLADDPCCEDCLDHGRTTPATDVHHMIKLATAPELRHDRNNLRSLCATCHSIRTRRGE